MKNYNLQQIAYNCRIKLNKNDQNSMDELIKELYTWLEDIKDLDTSDLEPTFSPITRQAKLRKDEVKNMVNEEDSIKNAPEEIEHYFAVSKMIEE